MARALAIAAGVCAVASGLAYVAYPLLGSPDWAISGWNLLIVPTALYLGVRFASTAPILAAVSCAAGIAASLLWAPDYRQAAVEPWWIGLAAVWWLGLGVLLRPEHRITAWLTLVLGLASAVDFVVTLLGFGLPLLALGGLKLPLATVWSLWIGILLIRAPGDPVEGRASLTAAAAPMALAGGAVWAVCAVGWLLTHGIQADPNRAQLAGLRGTELTQIMAVAPIFWAVVLGATLPQVGRRLPARFGWAIALLGVVMVGAGALLETSVVDPSRDFLHPAVQGGWLLFLGGLFPAICLGLLGLAAGSEASRPLRSGFAVAGAFAPLTVLAFALGGLAASGAVWVTALAAMHAAPGIGWMVVGSLWKPDRSTDEATPTVAD